MPLHINTTKKVHPFAQSWAAIQKNLSKKKEQILVAANWSESTFHNKLNEALQNKLVLNEVEANAIATVLQIDINQLLNN